MFYWYFQQGECLQKTMQHFTPTWNDFLYVCEMIIIIHPVHWLILYLLRSVCFLFHLDYFSWYICGWFYKKWILCMFVKWSLSYIQFIDWFFTCLDLYVISFHLNYCSVYDLGCLRRNKYFVWLWHDYYVISSSLINFLLA